MRSFFSFLAALFTCTFLHAGRDLPLDRFHVCTVATFEHGNLTKLRQSCRLHGMELKVLAMGAPYYGHGTKLVHMLAYLNTLQDDEIVMFVDGFDVLVVADKEVILRKFLDMNIPFLMAAEKTAYPADVQHLYPPSPTPFRYINTGTYIGYVGIIKEWILALQPDPSYCDQHQAVYHYFSAEENRRFYHLDYYCHLFLPLHGVKESEVEIDIKKSSVFCFTTQSYPSVLHANAWAMTIWEKAYNQLIKPRLNF